EQVEQKGRLFEEYLSVICARALRRKGLMMAVEFYSKEQCLRIINELIKKGVFTDWFLFAPHCMRIAPALNIPDALIQQACEIIAECVHAEIKLK
ncbi:MAG: aminotransferase class III-fold pyridoxal phosphate-dependent enzyme, partial [Chitinophagales bacterium]|nr:aminotransferase class III-fold pyridoxal phosphate-dependent enzyme [Chitinophagales bacterium]